MNHAQADRIFGQDHDVIACLNYLLDILALDIGIDDRRDLGANSRGQCLRLLRARDQVFDTGGPFECCQEFRCPHPL